MTFHAFSRLGVFPKRIHFFQRRVFRSLSCLGKTVFYVAETANEFAVASAERFFGIDAEASRDIDACEQQVAHLRRKLRLAAPVADCLLEFAKLLIDLGYRRTEVGPVEIDAGRAFLKLSSP